MGFPRAGFGEAGSGGCGSGGGAASPGQRESPLAGIEMLAVGEGKETAVLSTVRGSVVKHGKERGAAKGVVKLGALLLARGEVEGPVDFGRYSLGERSSSSLAEMLLDGLRPASVRNLTRSPGAGRAILADLQIFCECSRCHDMVVEEKEARS
jgi:hypothetical protein